MQRKKLFSWVKKHSFLLKLIFFSSILIFVANQFTSILQGMSFQDFKNYLTQLSFFQLLVMFSVGLLASLVLIFYDAVAQGALKRLGQRPIPKKEWVAKAFIINSLNNFLGFGGVIGATLRGNFYQKDLPKGKVLATVSKMAFFMLSGLSVLSSFSFVALWLFPVEAYFKQYWFWLLGGSLYAPVLCVFAVTKGKKLFQEFLPAGIFQLVAASIAQWVGALGTFLVIGKLLNLQFSFLELMILFLATSLIGMLTMVPGGAGTFDVLMILGLAQMGIPKEVALLWLLYYRLSYYILPFLLGAIFFIHSTGVKVNQFFDGLPKIIGQRTAHYILTGAVYFAGITMVLLSTVTNLSNLSALFHFLLPFSFDFLDQTLNILVGVLLLGLARGVAGKVKKAYLPTLLLLAFGILNTIIRTKNWRLIIVYFFILVAVYVSRKEFYREKLVYSFGAMLFDGLLSASLLIMYAIAGFYAQKNVSGEFFSGHFLLFPSGAVWLKGLIGLGLAFIVVGTLLTYLMQGPDLRETALETLPKEFLAQHFLWMTPLLTEETKGFLYQVKGQPALFFPYQRKANKLFVLGNPLGAKKEWKKGLLTFMKIADDLGYQLAFYQVTPDFVALLHDFGFDYLKIGEVGLVKQPPKLSPLPEGFQEERILKTAKTKQESLQAQLTIENIPISLSLKSPQDITVLYENKKIVGLLTTDFIEAEKTIYLGASWGQDAASYHLLLKNYLSSQLPEKTRFNLGFFPLANVGMTRFSFLTERLVQVINRYGLQKTSWQQELKAKASLIEDTENRYMAYRKNANGVVALGQLVRLVLKGKNN